MGIWDGIKRASKSMIEGPGPGVFVAAGKEIQCPHCGHNVFAESQAVLQSVGKPVASLKCEECGRIELFDPPPQRQERRPKAPSV